MSEPESAHGELTPIDRKYNGPRFLAMLAATMLVALTIIYVCASVKTGDYSWHPFAHDFVKHSLQSSSF